jgi:hypothetical protein
MTIYNDYPFAEIVKACAEKIAAGHSIHQKFTCSSCGSRQTMAEPNRLFTSGYCEECGAITDIKQQGCNYMLIAHVAKGS